MPKARFECLNAVGQLGSWAEARATAISNTVHSSETKDLLDPAERYIYRVARRC
jgi:hypothetical protein